MSTKLITYTGLLNDVYYRSKEIDTREVLQLLRQARAIPQQLLPFKGVIHVIDYIQHRHVGISGPLKNMVGYNPQDVMDNGLDFVMSIFQKDDFKIYNETIFSKVVSLLKETPQADHGDYTFSFTYRMRKADKSWMHLYQQGSYITDPATSLPLYSIAMVTDISPIKKDNSMIYTVDRKLKDESFLRYINLQTDYFYPDPDESKISKREKEVLGWLAEGLSSKQIAAKLYISESTVTIHRKNMLKKSNTKNIAELVHYGIKKGII
jgi:DNA-binding CsgD family transcriptional regulator